MAKRDDHEEKKEVNVSVWLTEKEAQELDQERREAVAAVPGARLSRSALIAQVYRDHLRTRRGSAA